LWTVGGDLTVSIAGKEISIDGFLVFAAIIYALIANSCMLLIGRRFTLIAERKNQAEAEYRFGLTRVRENAESIALLGGQEAERVELDRSFAKLLARWCDLVGQHMRTVVVSQGSAQLCGVIPILLCTPRFLEGTMTLGQIMQVASAFTIVQSALSWVVDN
jgi:vitamin B12/bleomycin/antimicrobial peptide transport system ATP-binding/permease protein